MKLHLPPTLRKALLATFVSATAFVVSTSAASASTASVTPPGADASYNVRSVTTTTTETVYLGAVEGEKTLDSGDGTTGKAYTADANNHFKGGSDAIIRNTANGNAWIQNIESGWNEFVGTYRVDGGSMSLSNVRGGSDNAVKIQIGVNSSQQNNGTLVFLNGTSLTASGLTMRSNTVLTLTGSGDSLSLSGDASMSGNSTIGGDGILTLQDGSSLTMTGGSNSLGHVVVAAGASGSSLTVAGTSNSIADLSVKGTANITLGEGTGAGNLSIKDLSVSSEGGLALSGKGSISVTHASLDAAISSTGITLNINSLVIGNTDAIKDVSKINLTSPSGLSSLILNSSLNTSSPRLGLSNDMMVLNLGGSALVNYAASGLSDLFDSTYSWDGKTIALAPTGNITKDQVLGLIHQIETMGASLDTTMPSVLASMVYTMPFTGNSYLTKNDGDGTAMLINDQSGFTGTYNIEKGSLLFVDPGFTASNKSLVQDGKIVLADNTTATFNISGGNTLAQKGDVSGSGNVVKDGSGSLTLYTDANVFANLTGTVTVNGGILNVYTVNGGKTQVFGTGDTNVSSLVLNDGATLRISPNNGDNDKTVVTIMAPVTLNGGSTVRVLDGCNSDVGEALVFEKTVTVNDSVSLISDWDKVIRMKSLAGDGTLNWQAGKQGGGDRWLKLNSANDFSGTIRVSGDTDGERSAGLWLEHANAAQYAHIILEGNRAVAKLRLENTDATIASLTGGSNSNVSADATAVRTLTVSSGAYSGQFSNINITKVGEDILTLSNSNGNGNVKALDIQNGTVNYAAPGVESIAMGQEGAATLNLTGGDLTNSGALTVSANGGTINLDSHTLTVNGAVSGAGALNLIGTGTAVFVNGSGDYSGGVNLGGAANLELRANFGSSGNAINVAEGNHTIIFKTNQTTSSISMVQGANLTLDVRTGNHGWGAKITNEGGILTIASGDSKAAFLYGNDSSLGDLVLVTEARIGTGGQTLSASSVSGDTTNSRLTIWGNSTFNVSNAVNVKYLLLDNNNTNSNKITAASIAAGTLTMANAGGGTVEATGNITFDGWGNDGRGTIQSTGGNITANEAVISINNLALKANGELNLTKGGTLSAATLQAGTLNVGTDDAGNRTALTLSGTSTIKADATNIRAGETLSIAASTDNKLGALDIAANGTLAMTDGAQATTATGISTASTNPQNVTNAGQINLAGQSTKLTAGNITGSGGITLDGKAELAAASVELSGTASITGGSSVNSTGAVNLSGQTTITDSSLQGSSITLADATVTDGVDGTTSLNAGTGVLQIGKGEVTLDTAGSSITAGSVIIGTDAAEADAKVELAAGTMSLGDITINKSGQLVVGMNLGANDKSVTNAGSLSVEGGKILTVSALTSTGTAAIGGAVSAVNDIALSGSVSLNGGSLTSSAGGITLSDVSSMDNATITAADATSGTVTFTGDADDKNVTLKAQNLTIAAGTVNFGDKGATAKETGQITIAGTTTINANAELSLHNHKTASNPDSLGAIVNAGNLRIVNTDATAVSWSGAGTLELGAGNLYFGNLTLTSKEAQTINGLVSLKGAGGTLKAAGNLTLKSVSVGKAVGNLIEADGDLIVNKIASTDSSVATFKGANVTVDVSSADSKTFRGIALTATGQQGTVTLNDVVSQGANSVTAAALIVDGTTTLTNADALTLTTGTTINSGALLTLADSGSSSNTLALMAVSQWGTLDIQANVAATATSLTDTAGSSTTVGGTLTVTNAMTVIGNLSVGGNLVSANGLTATDKTIGGTGTLTVGNHLSLGSGSFGGYVVLSSDTSVDGSLGTINTASHKLTIGDSKTMTLTGAEASTINGGLDGRGTLALTGEGTVNYTGSGDFAGTVNVSNGILNIGDNGSTTTTLGELVGMNLSGDGAVNVNANLTTKALSMEGTSKLNVSGNGVSMTLNQGDDKSTALTADQLSVTGGASFIAQGTLSIDNTSGTVVRSNGTIQAKDLTVSGKTAGVDADNKLNLKGTDSLTVSGNDSLSHSVLTTGTDGSSGTLYLDKVASDGTNTLNTNALVIAGGSPGTAIHTTKLKDTDVLKLAGTSTSTTINQYGELFITDGDTSPSVSTINLDAITNNGLLTIDHDVAAQATSIGGAGTLTINAKDAPETSLNGVLTVTDKVTLDANGIVNLNGDLVAQGGFESTNAANFHGTGNLQVAQTYKMLAGLNNDFSGTVVLIGDTTAEGRAPQIDTVDKTLTIDDGKTFAIDLTDSTSTIGSLAGSGMLEMNAKGGTLKLTAAGGFAGTLTQNAGTIHITAGSSGSSSFGPLAAIDINGGWMDVATDIKTAQLTVDGEPTFINGFLFIGNDATLTVSGNAETILNGMLGLGVYGSNPSSDTQGTLKVTNGDLTVNKLDDGAYGTLDASGHTLTVSGITTGLSEKERLTMKAKDIVLKPTSKSTGFQYVDAEATDTLTFFLNTSKVDVSESTISAATLLVNGAAAKDYVQIMDSVLTLTTGTTVNQATLAFSKSAAVGKQTSYDLKAVTLQNGGNLVVNGSQLTFTTWSDGGNTGTVDLFDGSLSQAFGTDGNITINSTVSGGSAMLAVNGNLTLAGTGNELDGDTVQSAKTLTLQGSYTTLSGSSLLGDTIVLDSTDLFGTGLKLMKNAEEGKSTSLTVSTSAKLAGSYINTAKTTIADGQKLTLSGSYAANSLTRDIADGTSELGEITLSAEGDNELALINGARANFKSYSDQDTSALTISDSTLTQTATSGSGITVNGATTITNTANNLQASLTTTDSLTLAGDNTITGVEGGEKALVSTKGDLTVGSEGHTNDISDAALSAGNKADNKTFKLAGKTNQLAGNSIDAQNIVFSSTGNATVTVKSLIDGLTASYSDTVAGTKNALSGTNLTVNKATQLSEGSLNLTGNAVTTTINNGAMLQLDNVTLDGTSGSVVELGSIHVNGETDLTTLSITGGTQAHGSSLAMTGNSFLSIDGTDGKLNTTLTLETSEVLTQSTFSGISVANNGHLVFKTGNITITEANKDKIKWDASSEIRTEAGNIVFNGVVDDFEGAPVRGEIVTEGNFDVELINGAQIYATGVSTHNLNLHDDATKLKIAISDQGGATWSKMEIRDTLSLTNGADLDIANDSKGIDLGTLGILAVNGNSNVSLTGQANSDDFFTTKTITLTDSSMNVEHLALNAANASVSVILRGASELTLNGATLAGYDVLSLAGASSASLNNVTLDHVGGINMNSTGTLAFTGTNDLDTAVVTMTSGSASITGRTTGSFALAGGSGLTIGGVDSGELIGQVDFHGGTLFIANLGDSSGLLLNTGIGGNGTVSIADGQKLALEADSLTGSGTLTVTGQGALTVNGTQSAFSSNVNYGAGTLTLGANNALGTGMLTLTNDTTDMIVSGSQSNTLSFIGKTLNLASNGTVTWTKNVTGGHLNVTGSATTLAGPVKLSTLTADGIAVQLTNIGADALNANDIDSLVSANGGSISNGSAIGKGYYGSYGSLTVTGGSSITLHDAAVKGAINADTGTIALTNTAANLGFNDITVSENGELSIDGGTLSTGGDLTGNGSVVLTDLAAHVGSVDFEGNLELDNAGITATSDIDLTNATLTVSDDGGMLESGGDMDLGAVTAQYLKLTANHGVLTFNGTTDLTDSMVNVGALDVKAATTLTDSLLNVASETTLNASLTLTGTNQPSLGNTLGTIVGGSGTLRLNNAQVTASGWTATDASLAMDNGTLFLNDARLVTLQGLTMSNGSVLNAKAGLTVTDVVETLQGSSITAGGDLTFSNGLKDASASTLKATGDIVVTDTSLKGSALNLQNAIVRAGKNVELAPGEGRDSSINLTGAAVTAEMGNISIHGSLVSSVGNVTLQALQGDVLLDSSGTIAWSGSTIQAQELVLDSSGRHTFSGTSTIDVNALTFQGTSGLSTLTLSGTGTYKLGVISNTGNEEKVLYITGAQASGTSITDTRLEMSSSVLTLSGEAQLNAGYVKLDDSTLNAANITAQSRRTIFDHATVLATAGDIVLKSSGNIKTIKLAGTETSTFMANRDIVMVGVDSYNASSQANASLSAGRDISLSNAVFDDLTASAGNAVTLDGVTGGKNHQVSLSGKTLSVTGQTGTTLSGSSTLINFVSGSSLTAALTVSHLANGSVMGAVNVSGNGSLKLTGDGGTLGMSGLTIGSGSNALTNLNVDLGGGNLVLTAGTLTLDGTSMQNGSLLTTEIGTTLTLNNASSLAISGAGTIDGTLELNGGSLLTTGGALKVNSQVAGMNGTVTSGGDMTFAGGLSTTGLGNVLNAVGHTLTLGAASSLAGTTVHAGTLAVNGATTVDADSLLNVSGATGIEAALTLNGGRGTHELGTTIDNSGSLTVGKDGSAAGGTLSGDGDLTVEGELNLREGAMVGGTAAIAGDLTAAGDILLSQVASISGRVTSSNGSVGLGGDNKNLTGATVNAAGDLLILGSNAELGEGRLVLTAGRNLVVNEGLTDSDATASVSLEGMDVDLGATTLTSALTDLEVGGTLSVDENLTIGRLANDSSLGNVVTSGDSALSLKGEGGTVTATGLTLGGASVRLESMNMDLGTAGVAALNSGTLDLVGMSLSGQSMTTAAGTTLTLGTKDTTMKNTSLIDLTGDFTANGAVAFYDGSIIKAHTVTFNGSVTGDMGIESGTDIYLHDVDGVLNLKAGRTIDITNGDKLVAGSSLEAVNLAVHGADALTATNTSFSISGTTTIDRAGALNLIWTTARTTDSLGTVTVSEGAFSATGVEGTELTVNGITAGGGSTASLNNLTLNGGISTVADEQLDTVNLTDATVTGNITVNGGDVMNMTTSTVKGTVLLNGSTLNVLATGENSINTLTLAYDARVNINQGAILNVDTTGIGTGSDMRINGTVTGNVTLMGGTATLGSTGILTGNLGIQGGTLTYQGGRVDGDLSFLADPVGNSVINLESSWSLGNGKALAVNGDGTINMGSNSMTSHGLTGNGDLTLTGSGTFTFDKTGTHTGNIVLKDSVSITALGENYGMGTSGSLIAESGEHTITIGKDQSKGLVINKGSTVNLVTTRDLEWQGLINNRGILNVEVGVSPLYLTYSGSDLGDLNLTQGEVALSHWNSTPLLDMKARDITSNAGTTFKLQKSSLTADSMTLEGALTGLDGSKLTLTNGLTANSIDLEGTTVSARSIQANATSLGNNSKLTATEDLTLSGITNIGNGVSLAGGNVSLSSTAELTSNNLSLTAGHKLLLNSGTYIWTNSTVDVHDSTTLAESVRLTLTGGDGYSFGNLTNAGSMILSAGATAQATTVTNTGSLTIGGTLNSSGAVTSTGELALSGTLTGTDIALSGATDEANDLLGGTIRASGNLSIAQAILGGTTLSGMTVSFDGAVNGGADNTVTAGSLLVNTDVAMAGSTITVSDSTTIDAGKTLSLTGGTQSFGMLTGGAGSVLGLAGGATAEAKDIRFADGSITLDASSLTTTTGADSAIGSLTLAGDSSLETAGDLEITTLEDEANGSIVSDGDLTIDNDITTSDTLSLIAGGTLTLQGDSSTINGDDSLLAGETISVDGDLTMNGANASIEAIGEISLNNITMTGEGSSITTGGTLAISGSGNLEHTTVETGTLHLVKNGNGTNMTDVSLTAANTIVDAGKMLRLMAGNKYSLGITSITGDLNLGGNNEAANAATVTAESMSIGYSFDAKGRQIDGTLTVNTGSSLTVRHSLTSTGSTSIVGSVTAGTIVLSGNANDLSGYGTVDGGTLKSLSSMTITNATLGRTTLSSVTDMSIAGTLTDGGHNTLTSSEGNITLNASMTGTDNTISAANGTVDINAAISGDGLNVTAQDLVIDAALTTAGDYAGRGEITVAGTMDVNAAATLANVTLNVARTDITGSGSSLTVSNTGAFGKLGNVTVADHGTLTLTGTTAGTASSLSADISVSNNSTASLANTALAGSILVSADANTLTLAQTSVTGNVTLLGTTNRLTMTDSTIGQTLTMDGGQFDLYGANTVGELLLNTTNINLTLHDGATLNAVGKETVIDKNGLYRIEGTHTGNIRIANGTVDLGSEDYAGTLDGALALAYGTLNYNNADSAISAGNAITLTGESGFARNINVNADWDASGNSLVANADGVINLASNLTLGSIASGSGTITVNPTDRPRFLTLNETGEHTGDIVLNSSSDYIKSAGASSFKSVMLLTLNAANALGTDGALKVIGDNRLVLADGANQDKKIQLSGDGTDSLIVNVNNEDEATLYGTVTTGDGDMIVKIGSGTLNLEGIANTVHNLGVYEGIVNAPGSDGTVQVINKFGNLLVGGSEDGNSTLNLGYATLMGGSLIQADTNGTIRLNNVLGTSVGNVLTLDNGAITVNESDLSVNSVKNEGTFETTGTILNVTNGLHNMGAMTLKGNSTVNAGELVSSGDLNIGDGTDATKVGIVRDAALSGTTTIGSGSSLAAGQTVTVTGQTTVNGALSGKDIALNGSDAVVSGHDGRIEADRNLNAGSGSDLVMNGNSSVSAGNDMNLEGLVSVDGSLAAGNNLNVTGDGTTLEGTVTVNGNTTVGGSLTVTDGDVTLNGTANVTDKTTVNGNGSLTLDSTGAGDLGNVTVNDDGSLAVNGNGNSVNADNITMNGNASGSISDTVLNLNGGRGEITLNDASSLDIANTTVNGSISTTNTSSTDSTHLGLDTVDINGDLTVVGGDLVLSNDNTVSGSLNISDTVNVTVNDENGNPGTLVVKEGTLIDPNASLTIDEKSNFTSNVTMTGGSFTVNGNAEGNNFNGAISFKPNDDLTYPGASSPVVTINGTHNQNMGITVDADASINVNGTLNINGTLSSGSNGDDTLSLNANGETGEIVINSTNEGFEDDIAIGGGTLVVNANEAIGKDGTLSVTGEGVTLKNTADGATVSKDIATNDNGLTIQTDQDFILAGQLDAAGDTIVKSGDADLVLSHDPILNDAPSIIGTLDQTAGDVTIDGTDYTIGNLHIDAGDLNFTSLGGNTIHNVTAGEGSSITLTGANAATNGSSADILGNSETNEGAVELDGATLETNGTIVGLDTLKVGTSANGVGSSATLANSAGTITSTTVETGSELTLIDSAIEGTSLATSGTTNVTDTELTLDEAIYVQDGGILNLDGASVIDSDIVLSNGTVNILEGSSSVITADSTLDFNEGMLRSAGDRLVNVHENFTMEGTVRMTSDGTVMVDADKTMNVNGGFDGNGELHKTGNGTLAFNKADAAYTGTVNLKEGTIDATASNAYGSSSTLNIAGSGVTLQTGVRDGDPVRFDSALTVDGDHAFTVNTLADTAWNGQLAGAKGAMTKTGNATLAINNANSQGFVTAIKVNEGDLALNGNIGSNVTLARGTMLSGNGSTTGHVDARNDDTVIEIGEAGKANSGIETLTLGSAAFERSEADCMGVYKTGTKTIVDLDLANNASDKLVVTGKADLNNSLVEIRKGAYTPTQERSVADGTRFHIVDAGELTGTFHDEVQHDLYLLNAHLENTATGTDLVLSVNHKGADKHQNQSGISGVIESIDNDGIATGELLDMINAFKHTRSEAEAKAALDSVGGTRLSTMMSSMLAGNVNHLRNLRNSMGTGSYAISVTPDAKGGMISHGRSNTEVWVTPTAGYNKANGDSNAPGFSRSSWGAMMGAERSLDANTMLGISLGYDYARTEVLGATDETDTYNIDLYGTYRNGAWLNRASFGIGFHDFTNDRFVTVGDHFAHMSRGDANGTSLNFAYELSYTFQLDAKSTIAPLFTVESSLGWIGSYSEKGDIGNAALHLDRQDAWATILGLGGRYTRDFSVISSAPSARFEAMALMTFDVGDQGAPLTASFMGAPGRNFTVNPAANNRIGALIGAGVTVPFNERLSAFGGTNFEFRSGTRDFTANVGVRYTF